MQVAKSVFIVLGIVASNIVFMFYICNTRRQAIVDNRCSSPIVFIAARNAPAYDLIDWGTCDIAAFDIVRNGTIYDEGQVIKQNKQIVDISGGNPRQKRITIEQSKIKIARYQSQPMGVLLHSHDSTYYHSLIQFGARLQYVVDHCTSRDVVWVIRSSPTQQKILKLLNNPPVLNFSKFELSHRNHPS